MYGLVSKASHSLGILNQAETVMSCIKFITVYKSFMQSTMEHGYPCWACVPAFHLAPLETVKNKACCTIGISTREVDSQGLSLSH